MIRALTAKRGWRWSGIFLFWTLVGLAFGTQLYLTYLKLGNPVSWRFALGRALGDWYVVAALSAPALWLARRFRIEGGPVALEGGAARGRQRVVFHPMDGAAGRAGSRPDPSGPGLDELPLVLPARAGRAVLL